MLRYNFYRMMYVSPDEESTKRFSHNYLSARFTSPPLMKIMGKLERNDVFFKQVNETKSNIILTYASDDANRTRGPACDHLCLDEFQGMLWDIVPIIEEVLAISKIKREIFSGTPLTTDNTINQLWKRSDQMEWAMSTRFQADRDLVVLTGMREMPMDPSLTVRGIGAKAGFDLTFPVPRSNKVTMRVPVSAKNATGAQFKTVKEALAGGPLHFAALMRALGSKDGREIVLEVEALRDQGLLDRLEDGDYYLKK